MMPTPTGTVAPRPGHRVCDAVAAVAIAFAALVLLLATSADTGMVWDEAYTVRRERVLGEWFASLFLPRTGSSLWASFEDRELERSWPFSREEPDGHPPFYALLGLAGWWLGHNVLHPLAAYRIGPMALCAATAGILYHHLAQCCGRVGGLTAAGLVLLMPRTFTNAHYAHYDMPMSCLWLLAQVAFINSLRSPGWIASFGIALGLAAGTKFTGCFAVVAPVAWVAWIDGRAALQRLWHKVEVGQPGPITGRRVLAWGLPVAAFTLLVIQPPWWAHPFLGIERYVRSNLTRSQTIPIPTLYLDRVYNFSLPWHNTLVLTGVTTPVAVQVLALIGMAACWTRRRTDPSLMIWPLSWAVLMVVRASPHAPGHDVVRLFLPSVATLAVLGGHGVAWLSEVLRPRRLEWVAMAAASLALGESLAGIAQTYPYTDSYYNVAFGGLPAAERYGFELTYYGETVGGPEFLRWVRDEARRRPLTLLFAVPLSTLGYLREWGEIPPSVAIVTPSNGWGPNALEGVRSAVYVMQRRRGVYMPHEWWLEQYGRPHFSVNRQGVDLLRVYTFAEFRLALSATKDGRMPDSMRRHFVGEAADGR
jgi:hypothetical protein